MTVAALHHYTIRCTAAEVDGLADFYTRVLGLVVGPRPELPLAGAWLYAGNEPIVHLYANAELAGESPETSTGSLDHIAFRSANLGAMRSHLRSQRVHFSEAPVPGLPLHQLFIQDPTGLRIELTFWLENEPPGSV